ncbi:MAG: OpgC domain-containing protein [Hyphomicrobiaceae bacterium]|nr:OpgC domain-containing protein [Hyphomicrobiaceae bacterium]
MRSANAVDFWRGLALVMIFINHIPGIALGGLTLRNYAICDAAELFVFLAGWSLSYATGGPLHPEPFARTVFRLLSRALEIYRAQLVITMLALAFLASVALSTDNQLFLEWHNAASAFYDPVRTMIGIVLLTHQLGYFNILPLYVVLLLYAPLVVALARWRRWSALLMSLAIYAYALTTWATFPNWPAEERWYFNPLSWQLLLVLGFLSAELARSSEKFVQNVARLVPLAWAVSGVGAFVTLMHLWPDPMRVPEPRLLFLFDKTYLSPVRIISLLAIAIAFHAAFRYIERPLGPATTLMCALGRNSLPVFCIGSLLSLTGQIVRAMNEESFLLDCAIVICGVVLMGFTAWFVEWRSRVPGLSASRAS